MDDEIDCVVLITVEAKQGMHLPRQVIVPTSGSQGLTRLTASMMTISRSIWAGTAS